MNTDEELTAAPGWTVTYADLMSLLLTFFILLASMSEIRENDKYQGMADSLHEHFGQTSAAESLQPGESKPRNALFASLALAGRAKRKSLLMQSAASSKEPLEVSPRVRVVRPGSRTTVGTVVYFDEPSADLTPAAREDLLETAELLRGLPQKIEIRGHTSQRSTEENGGDAWSLAFHRAESAMNYLVDELKIEPKRIRLSVAGTHEPASTSADPAEQKANTRVEVFLLDELAEAPVAGESAGGPRTALTNPPRRF